MMVISDDGKSIHIYSVYGVSMYVHTYIHLLVLYVYTTDYTRYYRTKCINDQKYRPIYIPASFDIIKYQFCSKSKQCQSHHKVGDHPTGIPPKHGRTPICPSAASIGRPRRRARNARQTDRCRIRATSRAAPSLFPEGRDSRHFYLLCTACSVCCTLYSECHG